MATRIHYAYICDKCIFAASNYGRVTEHIRRDHIMRPEVHIQCKNLEPYQFHKCPSCEY